MVSPELCKKESGAIIGMDVGINHLIATSDKEFIGNDIKPLIANIKRKLQGSKGYTRAKKTLKYHMNKVVKEYFNNKDLRLVAPAVAWDRIGDCKYICQ